MDEMNKSDVKIRCITKIFWFKRIYTNCWKKL